MADLRSHLTQLKSELSDLMEATCGKNCSTEMTDSVTEAQFLHELETAVQQLQKKAIFLSLVFLDNANPTLSEITGSTDQLKAATANLSNKVYRRPASAGKTLLYNWNLYLVNLFKDTVDFVNSIISISSNTAAGANDLKTGIGKLCHRVETLSKIPKSNKSAAYVAAQSALALVEDALEELTAPDFPIKSASQDLLTGETLNMNTERSLEILSDDLEQGVIITEENGDNQVPNEFVSLEQILSDTEILQLLQISTGLVKTVKACLKKATTLLSNPTPDLDLKNEPIDEIVECCNKMSPTCDEFVLALYPPRRARLLESEATDLAAALKKLMRAFTESGLLDENDKQVEILSNAIEHNSTKLISFLNAQTH